MPPLYLRQPTAPVSGQLSALWQTGRTAAGVSSLQPVVKPTHSLVAPFDLWSRHGVIGERVIPGANDGLDRSLGLHQHIGNIVAIAVKHPSDQKTWNCNFAQRPHPFPPEWTVMLMLEIKQ